MTGGQSAIEARGLLEEAIKTEATLVTLAVSPSRMAANSSELGDLAKHPRLAFQNEAMRDEIQALGLTLRKKSGSYLIENYEFYSARLPSFLFNLFGQHANRNNLHTYEGRTPLQGDAQKKDFDILRKRLANYQQRFPENI